MARTSRARRPSGRRSTRTRSSARTGVIEIFTRPEHNLLVRLLGLIIRLRAELTVIAVALTARFWAWPRIEAWLGHTTALLATTALILGVLVVPVSRRFLSRRWWCATTRHRMRACYLQTRTMTHNGKLPYLLWSRPSPVGERVRVWLPAGLSVKDLEQVTTETAAACWAAEVRITPSRRQAALVIVDVVRRDPLTGTPLTPEMVYDLDPDTGFTADFTTDFTADTDPRSSTYDRFDPAWTEPVTDGASDTDTVGGNNDGTIVPPPTPSTPATGDTPDTGTPGGTASRNGARTRTRTDSTGEPPVTGFGGVDVSDYL